MTFLGFYPQSCCHIFFSPLKASLEMVTVMWSVVMTAVTDMVAVVIRMIEVVIMVMTGD